MKTNTSLTRLDLKRVTSLNRLALSSHPKTTVNQIGDEGAGAIGEALKANSSLEKLHLGIIIQQYHHFYFHVFKTRIIKLEMKDQKSLLRHSRQTLHSKNLSSQQYERLLFSFFKSLSTANHIREEGGKAIAEALKENETLILLDIGVIQHQHHFSFSHFKLQVIQSEMKEGQPFVRQ